jgi:hypothetical protein
MPRRSGIEPEQIQDRGREAAPEVFHAAGAAVHALRQAAGRVSQVRHLPDLLPQACGPGLYSGREKGELVNPAIEKRALLT